MWIKICGITRLQDAISVQQAGANAIGLNFYSGSKRAIGQETARRLTSSLQISDDGAEDNSPGMEIVGVFVNASPEMIVQTVTSVRLTAVQFHGDESVADILRVHDRQPGVRLIRAVRVGVQNLSDVVENIQQLVNAVPISAVLLDALVPGQYGGTGHSVTHEIVRAIRSTEWMPKIILAGGLNPDNIRETISLCQPWGVDTASGVENAPGIKDPELVERFVRAARKATPAITGDSKNL